MTQDLKNKFKVALVKTYAARIKKEFPNASATPSIHHYEQQADTQIEYLDELIKELTEREAKLVEALNNTLKFMQQIQDDHKNKGRYYLPSGNALLHDTRYWEEKLQEILKKLGIEI